MISADHPRFSCTSDMSLTIYGKNFSGPLVHTNDPSGTGVISILLNSSKKITIIAAQMNNTGVIFVRMCNTAGAVGLMLQYYCSTASTANFTADLEMFGISRGRIVLSV